MALIPGTNVAAPIVPGSTDDVFPTHDAQYGRGGYRAVANVAERDAIPTERRSVGMVVRDASTNVEWVLASDLVTWGRNSSSYIRLQDLEDVIIDSKTDNDIIAYDATNDVWINKPQEYLVDGGNW
jgi:hypothetical protein